MGVDVHKVWHYFNHAIEKQEWVAKCGLTFPEFKPSFMRKHWSDDVTCKKCILVGNGLRDRYERERFRNTKDKEIVFAPGQARYIEGRRVENKASVTVIFKNGKFYAEDGRELVTGEKKKRARK